MNVAAHIRQVYEKRPYPATTGKPRFRWRLPPVEWMEALWQPVRLAPEKILVAGCGTGDEAFALARRFPRARIIAVDFSRHSIAIAQEQLKQAARFQRLRFLTGDLSKRNFSESVGRDFDFISCHGVLSYIPQPERVLRNFARCLRANGLLYLGVNGAGHYSSNWRKVLPEFGFEVNELKECDDLRQVLELCDAISGHEPIRIARQSASYLASDLFGHLIQNLTLQEWARLGRKAGLYLQGSYLTLRALRPVLNRNLVSCLLPRSRAEVAELLDTVYPASFHKLVFSLRECAPPWKNPRQLLDCYPELTDLYRFRWPRGKATWKVLRPLRLASLKTDTMVELQLPEWEVQTLRMSDARKSLREIVAQLPHPIPWRSLIPRLYLLYQLGALNLRSARRE